MRFVEYTRITLGTLQYTRIFISAPYKLSKKRAIQPSNFSRAPTAQYSAHVHNGRYQVSHL
jgi:hypothetical protein